MMRIRRVEIAAFGRLEDHSSGPEPLRGLVVVEGRNEAGKSSIFEFLCSVLYGIYPTSPDRHPFAPWSGAELGGTAWIGVGGGDEVRVTRRLLSAPSGTLARNGHSEAIRNEDLTFVQHVPEKVFRQVYALGLHELAGLKEEGWAAVEDRILGRLGATDLRPAREVVAELEEAARSLWRPDRRGSPRVRVLDEAIREISGRRPAVRERTEARRRAADELSELRRVLDSARKRRAADQHRLERLRILVPLRRELAHLETLRRDAAPPEHRAALPADPVAELRRRRERVEDLAREVAAARDESAVLAVDRDAYTAEDRALVEREADIDGFRGRVAGAEHTRTRLAGVERDLRGLDRRIEEESDRLAWTDGVDPGALRELPAAALAEAWARWTDARAREPGVGADGAPPATSHRAAAVLLGMGALTVAAAVLALAGVPPVDGPSRATALVAAGLGAVMAAVGGMLRASSRREEAARRHARERWVATESEARNRVASLLASAGLGLPKEPDPDLPGRVERCRHWLRDRDDLAREAAELRRALDEVEAEARALESLGASGAGAAADAALLRERLKEARDRGAASRRAGARLARMEASMDEAGRRLARAESELHTLLDRLADFDASDPDAAAEAAARRLDAAREADAREARLRADHPDLDRLTAELARAEEDEAPWLAEPDPVAELRAAVEQRTADIEGWVAREKELEAATAVHPGEESLDDLEGELRRLRAERAAARREHDRLWILARLVDQADQDVRELHQPDILRRAGEHLAILTGGRYDRLEVAGERHRALRVSGPAAGPGVEVGPPLSTGTCEQIYLALRLALVRHLDEGGQRLPLFLDEVLVNWDPERRRRGLDLLERTATERQVFLFTCHPDLADEVAARGASRWRLEGP